MVYLYHMNARIYYELAELVVVGRTNGNIICAEDGRMSGKHAQFCLETIENKEVVYVQDLGSKNRTSINRSEIPPNQKVKVKMYNLIEIGDQRFVVTQNKDVNIADLDVAIGRLLEKELIKLEAAGTEAAQSAPLTATGPTTYELVKIKEAKILELHNAITTLELNAKTELRNLEEVKEKIISNAKLKIGEHSKVLIALKTEVEQMKIQDAKVKLDLEQKKKKIINLKDLPIDSSEELPE